MERFKNFVLSDFLKANAELIEIQNLQDRFSEITGVACVLVDNQGQLVTIESGKCRLCRDIVRKSAEGQLNCIHALSDNDIQNIEPFFIRKCPISGLWDAIVPLYVKGQKVGNFYIGNVRSSLTVPSHVLEMAVKLNEERASIEQAYNEIAFMSESQFVGTVKLFKLFVDDIADRFFLYSELKESLKKDKLLSAELHKKEEKMRLTLDAIGDGVIITDTNAIIVDLNPSAAQMSGWSRVDAVGKNIFEVFDLQGVEGEFDREKYFNNVAQKGNVQFIEKDVILVSKNKNKHYIADSAAPIFDTSKSIIGVVIVFSDVTKKHIAEQALHESERSKSVLIDNLPGIAYRCGFEPSWPMLYISEGCFQLTGYLPNEFMTGEINYNDLILPEYRQLLWDAWQTVVADKSSLRQEYKIRTIDNKIRWVWEQGVAIFDEQGTVIALEGLIIDITERKMYEEMLHDAQRLANLGHIRYSFSSNKLKATELIPEILGIDRVADCSLNCLSKRIHPDSLDDTLLYFKYKFKEKKKIFDTKIKICRYNDNAERWVHLLGKITYTPEGEPLVISAAVQDITERRQAKEALRRSREELKMYASHLQNIREEERAFMARELHDTVSQPLLAVKMQLGMLKQMLAQLQSEADVAHEQMLMLQEMVEKSLDSINSTIQSSRKLTSELRSDMLDIVGFVEGIRLLLLNFENAYNVQCEFICNTNKIDLTIQQSIALYRIVQEALNNIARHANASLVRLYITKIGRRVHISVEDNGIGFDTSNERKLKSYGLLDIRERAHLLDAKLDIFSSVGNGTKITVDLVT